jgi:PTS system mannose-specific IIC component
VTDVIISSLVASCAGGVLSLDRTAAFQTMVSRPIVTAPVIGYLLGSVTTGLVVGTLLELLLMGDLPVGSYVPMHETAIATAVTALSVQISDLTGAVALQATGPGGVEALATALPVSFCLVFPVAFVYRRADNFTRVFNARFFRASSDSLASGVHVSLTGENLKGMVPVLLSTMAALLITVLPLALLLRFILSSGVWPWGAGPEVLYAALAGCVLLAVGSAASAVSGGARGIRIFLISAAGAGLAMVFIR